MNAVNLRHCQLVIITKKRVTSLSHQKKIIDLQGNITSRIGHKKAKIFDEITNILELFHRENSKKNISCVLVDEAQFFKKANQTTI